MLVYVWFIKNLYGNKLRYRQPCSNKEEKDILKPKVYYLIIIYIRKWIITLVSLT